MKKCLLMVSILMLIGVGTVNASNILYYGANAFPVSITNWDSYDGGATIFFDKYKDTLVGFWYVDPNKELDPAQLGSNFKSPSPCLAGFLSEDGANEIWIYDGVYLWTENPESKNEKFVFVGTGIFLDLDAKVSAAAYIDASGTSKQDRDGITQSIKMKGKVGAGMKADETWPRGFFIFNGQFSVNLNREEFQE